MSKYSKAPSMKARSPAPVDIITLGRCINPKCLTLLTGPRPSRRVERVFIVCPLCSCAQRIDRKLIE